jgi:hypothetical protein
MTDLYQSLSGADYSYLKIVADNWGFPFRARDVREGLDQLVNDLLSEHLISQAPERITSQEQEILLWLELQGGKELWDHFSRRYGTIREMGAGRLERERPDQNPISPVESLWYRALIARGFYETDSGPQEFVYIPDDLRRILIPRLKGDRELESLETFSCRKAAPREKKLEKQGSAGVLDHLCTLLAAVRMSLDPKVHLPEVTPPQQVFITTLALTLDLLEGENRASPEAIRDFFEGSRDNALLRLWVAWRHSKTIHDLKLLPGISVEGNPELNSIRVRETVLAYIRELDPETWWSIESFISRIKELDPDLLRVAGDYQSWFIKEDESEEYLQGFQHWDQVEGRLLRYLLTGPLHWLGFLDLGMPGEDEPPLAFRVSRYAEALLEDQEPELPSRPVDEVQVNSKGQIRMTPGVLHRTRYQIARFCHWEPIKIESYRYLITPSSLDRAEDQGLRVAHLLSLLENHTEAIPPNILSALSRWDKQGAQARIGTGTVLRLGSPKILKALKETRADRFIIEQLGPTAVLIREGSEEKISQALVEMGYFVKVDDQTGSQT